MRFQVPQFVDIEDRIIGPLTLKMFAYYAIAGLSLVPIYVLVDISLFITIALPILGMAALFAHVRLQGQAFASVLFNAVNFFGSARIYVWRRGGGADKMIISGSEYDEYAAPAESAPSSLTLLAQQLETEGNVSDLDAADPMLEEEDFETEAPTPTTSEQPRA